MLAAVLLAVALATAAEAEDLLPDMIMVADRMGDIRIDDTRTDRTLLRLTAMTPNIGRGRLEIRGGTPLSPTQRRVDQRIYRSDGSFWDRPAGTNTFHLVHGHVHFDDWAIKPSPARSVRSRGASRSLLRNTCTRAPIASRFVSVPLPTSRSAT